MMVLEIRLNQTEFKFEEKNLFNVQKLKIREKKYEFS